MIILNIYSHKKIQQVLNHGLVLKKVHSVIEFNNNAWIKPCIDMISKLGRKAKNSCEKNVRRQITK